LDLKYLISFSNTLLLLFKKYGIYLLKVFVTVGLLAYFLTRIKFEKILFGLKFVDFSIFGVVVLLFFVNLFLQFVRWKTLVKTVAKNVQTKEILESLLIGISAGSFTPGRTGEYFLRKLPLKEVSFSTVITLTFIDKMMLLINVIFWGSIVSFGMMIYYYNVDWFIVFSLFIIFVSVFAGLFSLLYSKRFYNFLKDIISKLPMKFELVKKLIKPLAELDNKLISKLLVLAFLNFSVIIFQFSLIVFAFDSHLRFENLVIASILVFFGKTLIPAISLGEIGVREGASIYFFGIFGCSESFAFNASLLLFVVNLFLPSLVGLILLLKLKRIDRNWQV